MGKEKFVYNKQTLRYEKVEVSLREKAIKVLGFVCAVAFTGFLFTIAVWKFFPSPQEEALLREISQLENRYVSLNEEFSKVEKVLTNIQERDASVHRMLFGMDPIDPDVWEGGVGGSEKYEDVVNYRRTGNTVKATLQRVDRVKRQLKLQSESLDTITHLALDRETMLASVPSIKPVRSDKLARDIRVLSGFGYRLHPIHKVKKMHTGIDFTAPTGTPIQATGDGKVVEIERKSTGYGHHVTIDHGYGYKTLYAHMSRIDVTPGATVKKGQQIGLVGSTGTSTAPHLHYEVIYKGNKVNPIHYCMDGLTPEEYQKLVEVASTSNQSFD